MASTVQDLERHVAALEQDIAALRQRLERLEGKRALADEDASDRAAIIAAWDKAMQQMGVNTAAVAPEKLREMMKESGVNPEDNEFSRAIIAAREE